MSTLGKSSSASNLLRMGDASDEGSIPVLNESNKKLEFEVEKLQKKLRDREDAQESISFRTQTMGEHARNIKQNLGQLREILQSKNKQMSTEGHMSQISLGQVEKMQKMNRTARNRLKEAKKRNSQREAAYKKKSSEIKKEMESRQMSQADFEKYLKRVAKADELNITVQKFMILDERMLNDLDVQVKRLNEEAEKKRRRLEALQTETRAMQLQLEKSHKELRASQMEQKQMLTKWEEAVQVVQKRDSEIEKMNEELNKTEETAAKKRNKMRSKDEEIQAKDDANSEMARQIIILQKQVVKTRTENEEGTKRNENLRDEVAGVKMDKGKAKASVKRHKAQLDHEEEEIKEKEEQVEELHQERLTQKQNQAAASKAGKSEAEISKSVDEKISLQENRQTELQRRLKQITEKLRKQKEIVTKVKKDESQLEKENLEAQKKKRVANRKVNQLEKEKNRHMDNVERQDAKVRGASNELKLVETKVDQSMVSNGSNEGSIASSRESTYTEKLAKLKELEEENAKTQKELEHSIKELEVEIGRSKKDLVRRAKEKIALNDQLSQLEVEVSQLEKHHKESNKQKEHKLVESNLKKVEVSRLEHMTKSMEDEVLDVGKMKEDAILELRVHQEETKAKRDMLQGELCQLEDERNRTAQDSNQMKAHLDQLKARYEAHRTGKNSSSSLSAATERDAIRRQIREKEDLEKEKAELERKLRKAETELEGAKNTLSLVHARNSTVRTEMASVSKRSEEFQEKETLQREYNELESQYKATRTVIKQLKDKIQQLESGLKRLKDNNNSNLLKVSEKEMVSTLKKDMAQQEKKITLLDSMNRSTEATLRKQLKPNSKSRSIHEKEIILSELTALNDAVENELDAIEQMVETRRSESRNGSVRLPHVSPTPSSAGSGNSRNSRGSKESERNGYGRPPSFLESIQQRSHSKKRLAAKSPSVSSMERSDATTSLPSLNRAKSHDHKSSPVY